MTDHDCHQLICDIESAFPSLPIKYHVSWRDVTTLGVGGEIPLLAEPQDDISLVHLLRYCNSRNIGIFVLGGGSNTVGMEGPFHGVVVKLSQNDFVKVKIGRDHVTVGSGVRLCDFILTAARRGLGGCAPLAAIPGAVGGAVRMNAEACGVAMGDRVVDVCGFDFSGKPWCASGDEIDWNYRNSTIPENVIVTCAILKMDRVDPNLEAEKVRAEISRRRGHDPKGRSAGCVFKNVTPELPAGKLIDLAGCKGIKSGGAEISEKHANYIINRDDASEKDFLDLAIKMREKVWETAGVYLNPEICFVNPASADKLTSSPRPMEVAVLKGGNSTEREVSLISGAAVAKALRQGGYQVDEIDIKEMEIVPGMLDAEVVFPVLHGGFGESGGIQKLMEEKNLRFVGCGSKASYIAFDKIESKKIMENKGIPTPKYHTVPRDNHAFPEDFSFPVVVKPFDQGSTVGVSIVHTVQEWEEALRKAFEFDRDYVMVEEFISGIEITVGVVLDKVLPVIEIRFPGEMFDYDAKYTHQLGETLYLCPPQNLSEDIQKRARDLAMQYCEAIGARDLMRVDMIVQDNGDIQVLEGNNLPGFTSSSLVPKAAKANGLSFVELCSQLVKNARR